MTHLRPLEAEADGHEVCEADMLAVLMIWLSVGGLALDLIGAALLAYDVLYGPEARFQASIRRDRLAITREMPTLDPAVNEAMAELRHWEKHEHRAQLMALAGLLLLMAGFLCQGVSTVLSGTAVRHPLESVRARCRMEQDRK